MGLFAALSAGVSGLDSQSNKIGMISNNISNVNTVGYKQVQAGFDTLVVPSGTTNFSPGGVIGDTQQLVNVQGTISGSTSPTDVAISGAGFFVVNSNDSGTGNTYYTRAGSFTQDANGDFVNSDGYFLMGLPINSNGVTAEPNAQNLQVVTVSQSATGAATATSNVSVVANLDSTQTVLPGSKATATMSAANNTSSVNVGASGNQIIVGNDYGAASTNNLKRGDTLNIVNNGTTTDTYTYGGFTVGRDVSDGTNGDGGNSLVEDSPGAGFSTFDSTTFTPTNNSASAATPVLTLDSTAFTDGTISDGNTTFTIGGKTISIIAGATSGASIQDTGATTLAAVANYLNTQTLNSPYAGLTFSANAAGTTLYAVNTTAAPLTGASATYSNAVPTGDAGSAGSAVTASGNVNILSLAANANLAVGNTITIGTGTVTVVASGATGTNEINVGANNAATLNNLTTLLNANAATYGLTNFTISNNGAGTNAANLIATNNDAVNPHNVPAVALAAGTPTTATPANAASLPAASAIGSFASGTIVAGDKIMVDGQIFTFVANGGNGTSTINIGGTLQATLNNLVTAMNGNATLNGASGDGLTFSAVASGTSGTLYAQDNQGTTSTPAVTYTKAITIASTTYSAITGFNVSSATASAVGGAGQLAAGTLIVDGAPAVTLTAGETLTQIATALQTALGGTSTASVTGSAGNYSLLVEDTSGPNLSGFDKTNSTAIASATSAATFSVVSPDSTPLANQLSIQVTNASDYTLGQYANISGVTASIGGIPANDINGDLKIVGVNTANNTIIVAANGTGTANSAVSGVSGGTDVVVTNRSFDFTGNVLNATSATTDFLTTGTTPLTASDFATDAMHFTVSVNGGTPQVFTYSTTPDPAEGTFNNMTTLAEAISDGQGLTATVADGRLYVSATNANDSVTFANGDSVGENGLPGINWTQELDLQNIPATTGVGANVFNSLSGLATVINASDPTNLTAVVANPNAAATLSITEANPEQTVNFSDGQAGGSILKELGFANLSPVTGSTGAFTTGTLGITYSPTASATDMSSGAVTPQFSHDVTVYDAQGNSHNLALNFVKLATNEWGVELTATPASSATSTTGDGQLANGIISFNGQGQISAVSGTIANTIAVNWTNGAAPSQISLNLGLGGSSTSTTTADLTQSSGASNVSSALPNGSPTGELTGVSIDQNGFVIANFSNGQTQKLYQLPLASVNNPDGLEAVSGNAYQQTLSSGIVNLQLAGTSGVGTFSPSSLEASNVDLSTQLTDLIVAQQAYGANSKLLTVADTLLQELDQIIQ